MIPSNEFVSISPTPRGTIVVDLADSAQIQYELVRQITPEMCVRLPAIDCTMSEERRITRCQKISSVFAHFHKECNVLTRVLKSRRERIRKRKEFKKFVALKRSRQMAQKSPSPPTTFCNAVWAQATDRKPTEGLKKWWSLYSDPLNSLYTSGLLKSEKVQGSKFSDLVAETVQPQLNKSCGDEQKHCIVNNALQLDTVNLKLPLELTDVISSDSTVESINAWLAKRLRKLNRLNQPVHQNPKRKCRRRKRRRRKRHNKHNATVPSTKTSVELELADL